MGAYLSERQVDLVKEATTKLTQAIATMMGAGFQADEIKAFVADTVMDVELIAARVAAEKKG